VTTPIDLANLCPEIRGLSFQQIAGGDFHSLALTTDGRVFEWGRKPDSSTTRDCPAEVPLADPIAQIGTGPSARYAFAAVSGVLYTWGNDGTCGSDCGDPRTVDNVVREIIAVDGGGDGSASLFGIAAY
jgi:alpha-tubulin suppressor-like RCC1 family protein